MLEKLKLRILKRFTRRELQVLDNDKLIVEIKKIIDDEIVTYDEAIELMNIMSKVINECIIYRIKDSADRINLQQVFKFLSSVYNLVGPINTTIQVLKDTVLKS